LVSNLSEERMSTFLTSVGGPDTLDYFVLFKFSLACHDKRAQPPSAPET
jgi:hypothetical protein